MPDILGLMAAAQADAARQQPVGEVEAAPEATAPTQAPPDEELLEYWREFKKECFEGRTVFERQWMRNLFYVLNRQWIEYFPREGRWKDKRLAPGIPRPVTNKCKETVQTIRSMFAAIKLGANVRPVGADPMNVSAAATADELQPLLYEAHDMDHVLQEFDFWLITLGNAFMHVFVDYNAKNGVNILHAEQCVGCQQVFQSAELTGAQPTCPSCGGTEFTPAVDPTTGAPMQTIQPIGRPTTLALSPLEIAFPNTYGRFQDVPGVVRLRWRSKRYYESHPSLMKQLEGIAWQKSVQDQSLQLFKTLANHNDLGAGGSYYDGLASESQEEGLPEYEAWIRPCEKYPQGLVFRVVGDANPVILHLEDTEGLPGPIPYVDVSGKALFPFTHAGYDYVGGRIWASGPLDLIIQKQDSLNQLDSMILLIVNRMSNPVWLEPKGAEIERLTGMPGLVIKYNPLTVGGNAKPERIAGEGPHASLFAIREQYLGDIETLVGTFDILKGSKPAGVEAFSAMQLLVERSQARFSSVFASRGAAFKEQLQLALELEREFGPDERTKAVLSPGKLWTFQNFKRSQLNGAFSVIVEDGSAVPKTSLGLRAAIDHANMLGMLNLKDPDQQYEGLKLFGLTKMVPSLDIHIQAALQKQQAFEQWVADPAAVQQALMAGSQAVQGAAMEAETADPMAQQPKMPSMLDFTPLKWRKWYNAAVHKQEFLKWANSDKIRELCLSEQGPAVEELLTAHLMEMDIAVMEQMAMSLDPMGAGATNGSGAAMNNSKNESSFGNEPGGPGRAEPA